MYNQYNWMLAINVQIANMMVAVCSAASTAAILTGPLYTHTLLLP